MGTPELWFRGEAAGGPVSTPGGSIHDFGDGMYLTDRFDVAKMYAETRTSQVDKQVVVAVIIGPDTVRSDRILDLRTDARWKAHFAQPGGERVLELLETGRMNEIYGKTFDSFLKANNLSRSQFDVIIGPEYVRGGSQMCIVQHGSAPSQLSIQLRSQFKPAMVGSVGPPPKAQYRAPEIRSVSRPISLGENFTMPNNPLRRMARNQNAVAAIGIAFESGMFWLQQKGIAREVRRRLETDYRDYVQQALNRGEGVLAIIYMDEWVLPDVNGFHPKMMVGLAVQSGSTQAEAMERYRSRPNLTPGPSANCRLYETYQWISGSDK